MPCKGNPDDRYPVGHTCFFSIDIPDYTSSDALREKLVYAITHTHSIDADRGETARLLAQENIDRNE